MEVISVILIVAIGYLLGCISSAFIIAKSSSNIDIRKYGSGNAGTTNVLRVLGIKAGALTFVFDVLKGVLAAYIGSLIIPEGVNIATGALICGAAAVVGHNWPIFLNFRGGKGMATSFGVILFILPQVALYLIGIAVVAILITKYVSIGSICASLSFPILVIIMNFNDLKDDRDLLIFSVFLSIIALIRHRENISRLIIGEESKIGQKKEPETENQ